MYEKIDQIADTAKELGKLSKFIDKSRRRSIGPLDQMQVDEYYRLRNKQENLLKELQMYKQKHKDRGS